ncbi:MAG: two-component regulator propeller domain-containing protein [Candidatus Marinimicrobia bacterium]|nr:two-component regulator propeller domain-containing protein [Candidatus Neomarinimicrobiota bacterium]MDP6966865.1 two-component regulator propeller domain-containing protein [Candidatus Neomarinimicrobiota bacterium]
MRLVVPSIILSSFLLAANGQMVFQRITNENGLSDNVIGSISDDNNGFVWLGTTEGLNRYDGYDVTVFSSNPFDSTALSGNRIWNLYKDSAGDLWAITDKGLDLYRYGKDSFTRYTTASRPVYVLEDRDGVLWAATKQSGVYRIDKSTGEVKSFQFSPLDPYTISSDDFDETQFTPIVEDTLGNLWFGTTNGLNYYRKDKDIFIRFFHSESDTNTVSDNRINTLLILDNSLWVGTPSGLDRIRIGDLKVERYARTRWFSMAQSYAVSQLIPFKTGAQMSGFWMATYSGLVYYDANMDMFDDVIYENLFGKFVRAVYEGIDGDLWIYVAGFKGIIHFKTSNFYSMYGLIDEDVDFETAVHDPEDAGSISGNEITSLFIDEMKNVWIGTTKGLNRLIKTPKYFQTLNPNTTKDIVRGHNIESVRIDSDNSVWIGHEKGVDHLTSSHELIRSYISDPMDENSLLTAETGILEISPEGGIWIASQYAGLTLIDPDSNKFTRFPNIEDVDRGDQLAGKIRTIYRDREGIMWFATYDGIAKHKLDRFVIYKYNPSMQNAHVAGVTAFLEDSGNHFWIGTESNGLFRTDKKTMEPTKHYILDPDDPNSFSSNVVASLYEDGDGTLWIGSAGEGLYRYNRDADNFARYSVGDGLPSNTISSITADNEGFLWMGTRRGVARMNPQEESFQSFTESDGLPGDILNPASIAVSSLGRLYFGGVAGLTTVNPGNITTNLDKPALAIETVETIDFRGNKQLVDFSEGAIEIDHRIQSIIVNFVGLSYNKSVKNQYAYSLENYLTNWVDNSTNRSVSLQGLDPDSYTFKFKASNNDGLWNEQPYTLQIKVNPPFWKTWWAYSSYALVVLVAGAFVVHQVDRAQRRKIEEKRKTDELAEARDLQLSMIAQEMPNISGVEVEAYMRTSTEVGGDYYDFFELPDGNIYAVCGDATGHGTKSGMMVSITKAGLSGIESESPDDILNLLDRVVKRVETGRLRMCLNVCVFKNGEIHLGSAAMPPIYHYSASSRQVEEIAISNLPLGGGVQEQFEKVERSFNDGDVLVMLSDGLPEAPNNEGHLLDYPAVRDCIENTASGGARKVKEALISLGDEWMAGVQNPDDITFIVFEKKESAQTATA